MNLSNTQKIGLGVGVVAVIIVIIIIIAMSSKKEEYMIDTNTTGQMMNYLSDISVSNNEFINAGNTALKQYVSNGTQQFEKNGIIFKWGTNITPTSSGDWFSGSKNVVFPQPFPNKLLHVFTQTSCIKDRMTNGESGVYNMTKEGFSYDNNTGTVGRPPKTRDNYPFSYFAIGI